MTVFALQATGITAPVELLDDLGEAVQKDVPISIVFENVLEPLTARGDVLHGVGGFHADEIGRDMTAPRQHDYVSRPGPAHRDPAHRCQA